MTQINSDTFRHIWNYESQQMIIQRVDPSDPLIVKDTFTLQRHELTEILRTALQLQDPFFRELALNILEGQNIARRNHNL